MPSRNEAVILLVEDNPADVRLFEEALRRHGAEVRLRVVRDGEEALRAIHGDPPFDHEPPPDLVVLDLNLPKTNGHEVLRHVKSDEALRHIPVIVLTTSGNAEDIAQAYDLHANCYIRKPVDLDGYMRAVHACESFWLQVVRLPGR